MPSQPRPAQPVSDLPETASPILGNGTAADPDGDNASVAARRIRVLPGATDTAASFEFEHEDHTLGNALRYMIMKNPDVELADTRSHIPVKRR